MDLETLGWDEQFAEAFVAVSKGGWRPGRVTVQLRGGYRILAEDGPVDAKVSGRFRHHARRNSDFPAVGDWVALQPSSTQKPPLIQAVLPRRTQLARNSAGNAVDEQVLAANLDYVLVVESLTAAPNLRRIERFLAVVLEGGAQPTVLLTKADLCADIDAAAADARSVSGGAPVHAVDNLTGEGTEPLRELVTPGSTVALLGPSGVGKSTFINCLAGETKQRVQEVRGTDQKGRHTTTHREMVILPGGGILVDTPGLRELQLWDVDSGVDDAFSDIEELALQCRFSDCRHGEEPGCGVREAVASGQLDRARLDSYFKLLDEQAHFERRHDIRAKTDEKRRWKNVAMKRREHKSLHDDEAP